MAEVSVSVCVGGAVREPSDCGNSYYDKGSTGAGRLRVQLYMPTDCSENVPELTDCLSAVSAIVEEAGVESVFIIQLVTSTRIQVSVFLNILRTFVWSKTGCVRT